jgi:hypothetical protein
LHAFGIDLCTSPQLLGSAELYLLSQTPATAFYNPSQNYAGISISHSNPYNLRELNVFQLGVVSEIKGEVFSFGAITLDNKIITDRVYYAGYAKHLPNLSIGLTGRCYHHGVTDYDVIYTFTAGIGAIWKNDIWTHGLTYTNITQTTVRNIELPTVYKYECMLIPIEKTRFAFSVEKEKSYDMRIGMGVRQEIAESLYVFTGFLTQPAQFSAGMTLALRDIEIGYGMRTHGHLGMTQAVGVGYRY